MNFRVISFLSSRSQSAYSYTLKNLFSSTSFASGRSVPNVSREAQKFYRRISAVIGTSVVPVLDKWIEEGNNVGKNDLDYIIRQLNFFKRFTHALEVSRWMTDKRFFTPTAGDLSLRLRFIYYVHGLEAAEKYFDNIPQQHKSRLAYNHLLSCYCHSKSLEKAESLMQKIRDLGYENTTCYTVLMAFYYQLRDYEKLALVVKEMEQKNIVPDKFAYTIQLSSYAAASDTDSMDKIVKIMESDPRIVMDATVYSIVASAYVKVGLHEKALEILGNLENVLVKARSKVGKSSRYDLLIELYGELGKKDDVLRIWNLHKKEHKILNKSHSSMLKTLVKLNEFEEAEKIFKEWETNTINYDFKTANFWIKAHCDSGEITKAEDILKNGIAKGGTPTTTTWLLLASFYIKDNQFDKMVKALENANSVNKWEAKKDMIVNCLKIFGGEGDIKRAETKDLIELLKLEGFHFLKVGDKVRDFVNAKNYSPDDRVKLN